MTNLYNNLGIMFIRTDLYSHTSLLCTERHTKCSMKNNYAKIEYKTTLLPITVYNPKGSMTSVLHLKQSTMYHYQLHYIYLFYTYSLQSY